MLDSYHRTIDYARISITDRCNLRCVYCMPEAGVEKLGRTQVLTYREIFRACEALAALGITKLKVTGGEPLVRRDICTLIEGLKGIKGIHSVTLTTNGVLLGEMAPALQKAGIDGVNVSLDSFDPEVYRRVTRWGSLSDALLGIDRALECGIAPVKINCVPMAGFNEADLSRVAALAKERPISVRFIEMMPIGLGRQYSGVKAEQVVAFLEAAHGPLTPSAGPRGNGPARYFRLPGFLGEIGFIDAVSHGFCERCNRVRLTSEGFLKTCLNYDCGADLRAPLRAGDAAALQEAIRVAIAQKPREHRFFCKNAQGVEARVMSQIGG